MTSGIERVQKVRNAVLAALFACALWLPLADNLLAIDPTPAVVKMGNPPPEPDPKIAFFPELKFEWESIRTFSKRFEDYYKGNIGFRASLLQGYARLKVHGLGLSTTDKVMVGKDGWYFYIAGKQVEHYTGELLLSEDDLAVWKNVLEARRDWLRERKIEYLFVIVPDKMTIYPEFLPGRMGPGAKHTLTDQLLDYMRKHSDVEILDLRPVLRDAKSKHLVYWPEDFHWTYVGAWVGYRKIIESVGKLLPSVDRPKTWDQLDKTGTVVRGDLIEMLAVGGTPKTRIFLEPPGGWSALRDKNYRLPPGYDWPRFEKWNSPFVMDREGNGPNLVMFHDSMTFLFRELLSEHFRRSVFIFHTSRNSPQWVPDLGSLRAVVASEKPDIVIEERTEMYLKDPPVDRELLALHQKRMSQKRFDASKDVLLRIDKDTGWKETRKLSGASVLKKNGSLVIRSTGNDPSVILPAFPFPRKGSVMVRIDITMPADSTLQLFYMTGSGKAYAEERSVRYIPGKGRNDFFLELESPDMAGRLRLDPGLVPGDYILHALEVRAVSRAE